MQRTSDHGHQSEKEESLKEEGWVMLLLYRRRLKCSFFNLLKSSDNIFPIIIMYQILITHSKNLKRVEVIKW